MSDDWSNVPAGLVGELSDAPAYDVDVVELLQGAATAALDVRRLKGELSAARSARNALYRQLTAAGMSSLAVQRELQQLLAAQGVDASELGGMGVTHDQVRRARLGEIS